MVEFRDFFRSQVRNRAHSDIHQDLVLAARLHRPFGRVQRRQLGQYGFMGHPHCVLPEHPVRHQQQIWSREHYHQPDVL
jgi:hypothetical protein